VTRVIAVLDREVASRRRALATHRAESLSAYIDAGHRDLPRIVLLVDGYPNLAATLGSGGASTGLEVWLDTLNRIIVDGRQVGLHTVLTADRRGVPAIVQSGIAARVVLRHADPAGYVDHGIAMHRAQHLDLAPGAGIWTDGRLTQLAALVDNPTGARQFEAIAHRSASLSGSVPAALRTAALGNDIELAVTPDPITRSVTVGVADISLDPVPVDLTWDGIAIVGPPRSGRSNAASIVARQLIAHGHRVIGVGPSRSPLATVTGFTLSGFGTGDVIGRCLTDATAIDPNRPTFVVFDDADTFDDGAVSAALTSMLARDTTRLVGVMSARSLQGFTMNETITRLRAEPTTLWLQPDRGEVFAARGVRAPIRPGTDVPPGRALFIHPTGMQLVQVPHRLTR
jgi:DNA segregation ATPase FtsK/SpoIIIE, S-DNA-T family